MGIHTLVPDSEFPQLRNPLPERERAENWRECFEIVDTGGWNEPAETEYSAARREG